MGTIVLAGKSFSKAKDSANKFEEQNFLKWIQE
jgi:hypothetical protein